jgi:hypothetical protein
MQTECHHSTGLKMPAPRCAYATEEQRSVIYFLVSEGVKP